jgi:lipopolysaccharide transport system permease protein
LARVPSGLRFMAFVTSNPTYATPSARRPAGYGTIRIEPPRGWFNLRLQELWDYRELLYFFVWRDVKIRYKQTAIGVLWVVLQPLLTMLVATLFFHRLAKIPSPGLPYAVFCFAALVPWSYFSTALLNATNVVVDNQRVITKVFFPRLILPFSAVLSGLVDFAIGFIVLFIFTISYGIRPTIAALLLPLFLLLAVLTALGVGLWLSALNALYRDVRFLMAFIIQFWTLASPVYYSSSMVPERYRWIYGLNPMAGVIDGFRWALTGRGQAPGAALIASTAMVCLVVFSGLIFFTHMETSIADRV